MCTAVALAGITVSDGENRGEKNQCLVKHRSFCLKFFGSAVEVVFSRQGSQLWLCRGPVALGHSQAEFSLRVPFQVSSAGVTLCASLEHLVELA